MLAEHKIVHLLVAFSSSSFSGKPIANVRRLYKFANRAPAPLVSRARRWVPIPHQKRVLEIHGKHKGKLRRLPSSTSFHSVHHVCTHPHCRTEVGGDAHGNHRVVQNNKHMEHAPHSLHQLPLTFDIAPIPLCRRIASKITEIISVSMLAPAIAHA